MTDDTLWLVGVGALAGIVAGFRAIQIDLQQRRWIWMALDCLWVMTAILVAWFVISAYSFGSSGV